MESYMHPHKRIFHELEYGILSGRLIPGCHISSIRILAVQYQVNPNTVQRAVRELEREGLFVSHRGNGITVTEDTEIIQRFRQKRANEIVRSFVEKMEALGYSHEQIEKYCELVSKTG